MIEKFIVEMILCTCSKCKHRWMYPALRYSNALIQAILKAPKKDSIIRPNAKLSLMCPRCHKQSWNNEEK